MYAQAHLLLILIVIRKERFGKSVPNPFCGLKSPTELSSLFGAILVIIVRPLPSLRETNK